MNDAFRVRGVESVRNLDGNVQSFLERNRLAGDALLQRLAFEQLHGDHRLAVVLGDFVNGADVRMIQSGSGARFAAKTFERVGIARDFGGKEFQRDKSAEVRILGFINHAHPAAAEFFDDAEVRNDLSGRAIGFGHWRVMLGIE